MGSRRPSRTWPRKKNAAQYDAVPTTSDMTRKFASADSSSRLSPFLSLSPEVNSVNIQHG